MCNATPISLAVKWYKKLPFPAEYDQAFQALTAQYPSLPEVAVADYTFGNQPEDGGLNLLMCLYFCEALAARYEEKGIPEDILLDTMEDIVIWANIYRQMHSGLGILETGWLRHHYNFELFRLGRLQFAFGGCNQDTPVAKKGEPVLEVHIPRTGPMTPEACRASFTQAKEFFARYFPEREYRCFTCFSWLLDSTLTQFMKPDSNILQFQKLFRVIFAAESVDVLRFTVSWKLTRETMDQFAPTNSFTQRAMEHIRQGGKFYISFGYLEIESIGG